MRFELLFVTALAATLGIKAVVNDYSVVIDHAALSTDISDALTAQGYRVEAVARRARPPYFLARREGCTIYVQSANVPASLHGAYRRDAGDVGSIFYQIGRLTYASPPSARVWLGDFWQTTLGRVGVAIDRDAPLVVARSPGCPLGQPDLSGLRLTISANGKAKGD